MIADYSGMHRPRGGFIINAKSLLIAVGVVEIILVQ